MRDRSRGGPAGLVVGGQLAIRRHVEHDAAVHVVPGQEQAERRAATRGAGQLDERQIVTVGQDPDPLGRDEPATNGATDTVEERAEAIARIHSLSSLAECPGGRLWTIPPGGIIPGISAQAALQSEGNLPMSPTEARPSTPAGDPDHFRHSYSKDRAQLIRRLSRMEGQVRGIARMIEREEYCIDILQQTAALRAAVDSLSILLLEDHVQGCVRTAAARGEADQYVDEVLDVVRRTLGRPVRGGRSA